MFINVTLQQAISRVQAGGIVWSLDSGEGWELNHPERWSKRAVRSWLVKLDQRTRDWFTNGEEPRFKVDCAKGE